jgi:hypothetical protein
VWCERRAALPYCGDRSGGDLVWPRWNALDDAHKLEDILHLPAVTLDDRLVELDPVIVVALECALNGVIGELEPLLLPEVEDVPKLHLAFLLLEARQRYAGASEQLGSTVFAREWSDFLFHFVCAMSLKFSKSVDAEDECERRRGRHVRKELCDALASEAVEY